MHVDFDGDVDGRDERIAGYMSNAALLNNHEVPAEPTDIMYDHNGGQAGGDETQSRCKSWHYDPLKEGQLTGKKSPLRRQLQ